MSLLLLLLPLLLVASTPQKRVGLRLQVSGGEHVDVPGRGAVQRLEVQVRGRLLAVEAELRRTDVTASSTDTEIRRVELPPRGEDLDLPGLQATLRDLKALDPERQRLSLLPADDVTGGALVALLDAVRADDSGILFPSPRLGALP